MRRKAEILTELLRLDDMLERARNEETVRWDDDVRVVAAMSVEAALQWVLGQELYGWGNNEPGDPEAPETQEAFTLLQFIDAITDKYDQVVPSQIRMVRRMSFAVAPKSPAQNT